MIRINLLGVAKPKKGGRRAPAIAMEGGEGGRGGVVAGIILVALVAGGNYFYHNRLDNQTTAVTQQLAKENAEGARLRDVKAKYEEKEAQYENAERRVCIINDLKNAQMGPVTLLTQVSDTVNMTDGVWLRTMLDQGNTVELRGNGLSVHAIANFMADLQKSGAFNTVEIKEAYQDDTVKDMQVFLFILVCEKKPATAPPGQQGPQQAECAKLLQKS
jgi:Tfp pilus assembly protein PilN